MRKIRFLPSLAFALGIVGAFLRNGELVSGFDRSTGLAVPGCAPRWILVALTAVCFLLLAVVAWLAKERLRPEETFQKAFRAKGYLSFTALALLGLVIVLCAVFCLKDERAPMGLTGPARWAFLALLALSGLGMAVMALSAYTQKELSFLSLGSVMPAFLYCYWLVALYRANAGNPVLADYVYAALAFATASVSFFYFAGYNFGRPSLAGGVLMGPSCIYFLVVSQADTWPNSLRAALIATAVYQTVLQTQFLGSLKERT